MSFVREGRIPTRVASLYVAVGGLCLSVACGGSGGSGVVRSDDGGGAAFWGDAAPSTNADGGAVGDGDGSAAEGGGNDGGHADGGADTSTPSALDAQVSPGGNFDLSVWELQEPIGSPGSPTTISPTQLVGPNGFHDAYFFTDPVDGAMTFWDPENGVTTANSNYPRSELREMTPGGQPANWPVAGTHTLSATIKATMIPNHVAVGQIHLGTGTPASTKPLLEIFYFASGAIVLGIEQTPAGGNEVQHPVGNVPLGTKWSYVIGLSGNAITLTIDGGATQAFAMSSTFNQENMYFKAGDYDQSVGTSATIGAKVQFYALKIAHGP